MVKATDTSFDPRFEYQNSVVTRSSRASQVSSTELVTETKKGKERNRPVHSADGEEIGSFGTWGMRVKFPSPPIQVAWRTNAPGL